jgi:hypothetical protein
VKVETCQDICKYSSKNFYLAFIVRNVKLVQRGTNQCLSINVFVSLILEISRDGHKGKEGPAGSLLIAVMRSTVWLHEMRMNLGRALGLPPTARLTHLPLFY